MKPLFYDASQNLAHPIFMIAYDIATAAIAAIMVGNEFAVAAFVHPQLQKLADGPHAQAAAPLATSLGKWMPFWYGASLALILGAAYQHRAESHSLGLILASAILWITTIVFTITILVPINNRIAKMDTQQPYDCWREDRIRWDHLHKVRVEVLIAALVLLLAGLFLGDAAVPTV
ncbi:MAG TPA: DUF1772 domain-containing protein [Edaphobacter sp.]|nr:DUF1772 domain-containing protein [Edaphobacter sp.]